MTRPAPFTLRRLTPDDAPAFHALRIEGFTRQPLQFRSGPEDEAALAPEQVRARLAREFVLGAFVPDGGAGETLVGIGGLARESRSKLRHKALIWGMYVRDTARGLGIGDAIVERLLTHAREVGVELVQLTVIADNAHARRVYERWGFATYGVEPAAVKVGDGPDAVYLDEALMAVRLGGPAGRSSA